MREAEHAQSSREMSVYNGSKHCVAALTENPPRVYLVFSAALSMRLHGVDPFCYRNEQRANVRGLPCESTLAFLSLLVFCGYHHSAVADFSMPKRAGNDAAKEQERRQPETEKVGLSAADATDTTTAADASISLLPGEELTSLTKDEMASVCEKLNEFARSNPDRVATSADVDRREKEDGGGKIARKCGQP